MEIGEIPKTLVRKLEEQRQCVILKGRREDYIKIHIKETVCEGVD
jgi:hypothetical protein